MNLSIHLRMSTRRRKSFRHHMNTYTTHTTHNSQPNPSKKSSTASPDLQSSFVMIFTLPYIRIYYFISTERNNYFTKLNTHSRASLFLLPRPFPLLWPLFFVLLLHRLHRSSSIDSHEHVTLRLESAQCGLCVPFSDFFVATIVYIQIAMTPRCKRVPGQRRRDLPG